MNEWRIGGFWSLFRLPKEPLDDADIQAKIEFLSMYKNSKLKADFIVKDFTAFWSWILEEYFVLSNKAMRRVIQAFTTYGCEVGGIFDHAKFENQSGE